MTQSQAKPHQTAGAAGSASAFRRMDALGMMNAPRNMEAVRDMAETVFEGFTQMNREFFRFMNTRFQEDVKAARSFAECRHPSEFVAAELRFIQSLVRHYADNTNRMLGIAANVMGHNLDDIEDAMTEAAAPETRGAA